MAGGMYGMCDRGCAWQEACVAGGMHWREHVWQGVMGGRGGHVWRERPPLQRTVCILLECILVFNKLCRFLSQ